MIHILRIENLHVTDEGGHNETASSVIVDGCDLFLRPREPKTAENFEVQFGIKLENHHFTFESLVGLDAEAKEEDVSLRTVLSL